MGSKINNSQITTTDKLHINGIGRYITDPATKIPIDGKLVHPSDIVAIFEDDLDARDIVRQRRAELKKALADQRAKDAKRRRAEVGLKAWVLNCYGDESAEAHAFGYAPKKRAEPTVDAKVRAVALARATREARGTKGPKAKLKIKGSLPPPPPLAEEEAGAAATTGAPFA